MDKDIRLPHYITTLFLIFLLGLAANVYAYRLDYKYEDEVSFTDGLTLGVRTGSVLNQLDKKYTFGMTQRGFRDVTIIGKDGWFIEVELDKRLNEYFSVGVESGHIEYDLDFTVNPEANSGMSGAMGNMEILPVIGHVRAEYPIEGHGEFSEVKYKFAPYVSAGVGGMFTDLAEDGYATSSGYNFNTDASALAGKYGIGLDFYFTEHLAINIEGSYIDMDVKTDLTNDGLTHTEDVHNNSWLIGGGLKYSF